MRSGPPSDSAVWADGVSKAFRLPHEQVSTLKERALHPLRGRTYDVLQALDRVSLDVRQGDFFGIVGRNGSGKSTLMKCLAGIYRADAGEIWMRGRLAPFIELGVGFNPDLTARDNVRINAIMFGLTPAQARERYDAIIEFAELERFVDLKLKNYSSGMHVRLAFAVMIHVDADVLLIDEVLAVGDASFQRKCHDALIAAREEGRTILLVTHDMNAVQRFCNRAMLLDHGSVIATDDPRVIAHQYEDINLAAPSSQPLPGIAHLGDGAAAIVDVWFEDEQGQRSDSVPQRHPCAIQTVIEFRSEVNDAQFGLTLTDEQQHRVLTATSPLSADSRRVYAVGERVQVAVRFDNQLRRGRYFASPEVGHPGTERRLMDHRERGATVSVTDASGAAGAMDLPYEVEVSPIEAPAVEAQGR
jgi:ABC-type polysaccharide/polyol phosphate transport system ATPase subunit